MEKIIIRTKIVTGIASNIVMQLDDCKNLQQILEMYGRNFVLKNIFEEDEKICEKIFHEYNMFIQNGRSDLFVWLYKINEEFGVTIDEHINLYHFDETLGIQEYQIFNWLYADSKKYLGDTWWFEDAEILKDIQNISLLDFYKKYKGY